MTYGISREVGTGFDETVARVTDELKKEGFGVLTSIDMRDTLRKKLDVDFPRYVILGACNPPFAYRALQAEEQIGLLLPCNVIVYEKEGKTMVSAFDPMTLTKLVDNPAIAGLAAEVKGRLERVVESL